MKISLLGKTMAVITSAHRERFRRIDVEDFSSVATWIGDARRQEDAPIGLGYLEHGVMALKQYYAIMVLDPANAHAAGPFITQFWHAHMRYSKGYKRFCRDVFGMVIDHVEIDHWDEDMVYAVREMYQYTRDLLPRVFHRQYVDPDFWAPRISKDARITCYQQISDEIPVALQRDRLFEPRSRCSRGPGFRTAAQAGR